jgi:hypothetical protein
MVLRNLMRAAYDREKRGEPAPTPAPKPPTPPKPQPARAKPQPARSDGELQKLITLRDQGILNDDEFEAAKKRLLAKR